MPKKTTKKKPLKKKLSNQELLAHWAVVIQNQHLWIANIIQSQGAAFLPGIGMTTKIWRNLSPEHFKAWRNDGVPVELINGLSAALGEEQATYEEMASRMKSEVTSRLADLVTGRLDNVKEIRRVFFVDNVSAGSSKDSIFPPNEDNEDARSDAFFYAWKEYDRECDAILQESWPLPVAESEFEASLYDMWHSQVLPALKKLLPIIVGSRRVNYIPHSVAMDRKNKGQAENRQKRRVFLVRSQDPEHFEKLLSGNHAGDPLSLQDPVQEGAIRKDLIIKLQQEAARISPAFARAVDLIIREGLSQSEAAKITGQSPSILSKRLSAAAKRVTGK